VAEKKVLEAQPLPASFVLQEWIVRRMTRCRGHNSRRFTILPQIPGKEMKK
jgi:hypothetical protein